MRRLTYIATVVGIVLLACASCRTISSLIHDDQVVAKAGRYSLYKSDLDKVIPATASPQDSMALALQYINAWASDVVFLDLAESQLSKSDKDVSKELEEYRRSLLKYKYEQKYVNERLDTTVTADEIGEYYSTHKDQFVLETPIAKVRYMRISKDSPNLSVIKKKMASTVVEDLVEADSLAYFSADIYTDYSGQWISIVRLAQNFGMDYGILISKVKRSMIETSDASGKLNVAYIVDYMGAGDVAPLDYCSEHIKDIIVSRRKHDLINDLERSLLDDARSKGKFEIL